jgi:hypothetical protein
MRIVDFVLEQKRSVSGPLNVVSGLLNIVSGPLNVVSGLLMQIGQWISGITCVVILIKHRVTMADHCPSAANRHLTTQGQ